MSGSSTGGTKVYLNGTLAISNGIISGSTSSYYFNVGHGVWDDNSTGPYLNGYVDELAIWDRVLSGTEIQQLANQ